MLYCDVEAKKGALAQDAAYLLLTRPWTYAAELPVRLRVVDSWDWMAAVLKALSNKMRYVDTSGCKSNCSYLFVVSF